MAAKCRKAMKQFLSHTVQCALFLFLASHHLQSQTVDPAKTRFWGTAGYGYALREYFAGNSIGGVFTFNPDWVTVSARYIHAQRGKRIQPEVPLERLSEISLLIGFSNARDPIYYGISAGPGLVHGVYNEVRAHESFSVLNVSFGGHSFYRLTHPLALGIYAFGNVNAEQSYFGLWITLNIGFYPAS